MYMYIYIYMYMYMYIYMYIGQSFKEVNLADIKNCV